MYCKLPARVIASRNKAQDVKAFLFSYHTKSSKTTQVDDYVLTYKGHTRALEYNRNRSYFNP